MDKTTLGDRMKNNYENVNRFYLTRRMPIVIRTDMKAGHTFTYQDKKLKKLTSYGWNMGVSGDDLILKINELIDAVNELRDKNDRQAK